MHVELLRKKNGRVNPNLNGKDWLGYGRNISGICFQSHFPEKKNFFFRAQNDLILPGDTSWNSTDGLCFPRVMKVSPPCNKFANSRKTRGIADESWKISRKVTRSRITSQNHPLRAVFCRGREFPLTLTAHTYVLRRYKFPKADALHRTPRLKKLEYC